MNYSKNKIAIVVQGASNYVEEIKNAWKDFKKDIIFSTWKGEENKYDKNDKVIFNETPLYPGPFNFNYQKISTYNGLLEAKKLGYTHALKIRSDYLPTNSKEFIKLLNPDKLNFLMWIYTSFLWIDYPTLNGYLDDHFSFGPIDDMITLWNIKDNFCHSPEIMLTWSYISKLKDKIGVNFVLDKLNDKNDLFYVKFNNISPNNSFGHNEINKNFGNRELYGRYESVFNNHSEYLTDIKKIDKFLNNNYLKFLSYFNPLPKISIFLSCSCHKDKLKNIIYPINKLDFNYDVNDSEYIIESDKIINDATLIIEYFKKINSIYLNTITKVEDFSNDNSELLTISEFIKNNQKDD